MIAVIRAKEGDCYKVSLYAYRKPVKLCNWNTQQLQRQLGLGTFVAGLSEDETVFYESLESYVQAMLIQRELFDADCIGSIVPIDIGGKPITDDLPETMHGVTYGYFVKSKEVPAEEELRIPDFVNFASFDGNYKPSCESVLRVIFPDSVDEIKGSIARFEYVEELRLPMGIKRIPAEFCKGMSNLKALHIPDSVNTIGSYAFINCHSIADLHLPKSLKMVGKSAFQYCQNVETIEFPSGVQSLGEKSFADCTGLRKVTVPTAPKDWYGNIDFLRYCGGPFEDCTGLVEAVLTGNGKTFQKGLFWKATALQSVVMPDTITKIPKLAFRGCVALQHVDLPSGLVTIDDDAFARTAIDELIMPDTVTEIGISICNGCTQLKKAVVSKAVNHLRREMFCDCTALVSVTLHDDIEKIDDAAFSGCRNLAVVEMPACVRRIGERAFYNTALTEVAIPESCEWLDAEAFKDCTKLEKATLPTSLYKVSEGAFEGCVRLVSVEIPQGVHVLESRVFSGCSSLLSVTLPYSVSALGLSCFADCRRLTEVTLSNDIARLDSHTFSNCESLRTVTLPMHLKSIGAFCFTNCKSLEQITLPSSCIELLCQCFSGCESLREINLPEGLSVLAYRSFYGCDALKKLILPESCKEVDAETIPTGLQLLYIPEKLDDVKNLFGVERSRSGELSLNSEYVACYPDLTVTIKETAKSLDAVMFAARKGIINNVKVIR